MRDALAKAKDRAVSPPMPVVPPPVMSTDLPLAESEGREGRVEGWAEVCQRLVGEEKGGVVDMVVRGVVCVDRVADVRIR